MKYVIYARNFGWTPDQVDNLPISVEPWLIPINTAIDSSIADKQAQAQAAANKKSKRR